MEKNFTLREFNISDNPIGSWSEGAAAFASVLATNQFLKILRLKDDSVGVEGALQLIESLKHNTTLEKLWLSEIYKPPSFLKQCKIVSYSILLCLPAHFTAHRHHTNTILLVSMTTVGAVHRNISLWPNITHSEKWCNLPLKQFML